VSFQKTGREKERASTHDPSPSPVVSIQALRRSPVKSRGDVVESSEGVASRVSSTLEDLKEAEAKRKDVSSRRSRKSREASLHRSLR